MSEEKEKILVVPHDKRHSAPLTWGGLEVKLDPSLPQDTIEIRDGSGKVLARAVVKKPSPRAQGRP